MRRKVVKHGPSTFIVSLPSRWVAEHNIKKGDELEVIDDGETILMSLNAIGTGVSLTADVSGLIPRLVDRFLARSYQKGYDEIRLIHNDLVLLDTVKTKVQELIGYEVIEQDHKTCLIKSISSRIELDFDNSLRRAFLMVKQMAETCLEAYSENQQDELNNIYLKDLEVNRHTYFCLRQINKQQYISSENAQQTHTLYYLIEILEDLGDAYKKLAIHLAKGSKPNKEMQKLLNMLLNQFEISYSYFYEASKERANNAFELFKEVEQRISLMTEKKLSPDEIASLILIKESSHIIYHFTTMRLDFLKEKEKSEPC